MEEKKQRERENTDFLRLILDWNVFGKHINKIKIFL